MPAQAGIHGLDGTWPPACAGVTEQDVMALSESAHRFSQIGTD